MRALALALASCVVVAVPSIALEQVSHHNAADLRASSDIAAIPKEAPDPEPKAAKHKRARPKKKLHGKKAIGFTWPVTKNIITSPFGARIEPVLPTPSPTPEAVAAKASVKVAAPSPTAEPKPQVQFHHGADIRCDIGDPVHASRGGAVVMAGMSEDYGNFAVIDHGHGWTTLYAHMSKLLVYGGQHVVRRQWIGKCGSTGRSTGPHLHFELRRTGRFLDPIPFLP